MTEWCAKARGGKQLAAKTKALNKQRSISAAVLIQATWKTSSSAKRARTTQALLENVQLEVARTRHQLQDMVKKNGQLEAEVEEIEDALQRVCDGSFEQNVL